MNTFRDDANEALRLMGEPPLRDTDVIGGAGAQAPDSTVGDIQLVEPPGHKRSDLVFMNGRRLILDHGRDEAADLIQAFLQERRTPLADMLPFCGRWRRRAHLDLDTIDVVGEDSKTGVVVRNRMRFSRRAIESVQSVGHFWTKFVPGRLMSEHDGSQASGTDRKIIEMRQNAAAAKRMRRRG